MNIDDLFEKHSTAYYDANEQKTEVLTKRRFSAAIAEIEQQLYVEERQNEMLIKECEDLKAENITQQEHLMHNESELIELRRAVKWALDNCKPERDELHSDFFNILTNAYCMHTEKSIDEEIEHVRNKNGYQ